MSDLTRLRELAALLRPPIVEARIRTRADLEKKFDALQEGIEASLKDLMYELGEGGVLETMMSDVGVAEHKDANHILEGLQTATTTFQKSIQGLLMEAEGLLFSAMTEGLEPEPVMEMAAASKFQGGFLARKDAKNMIALFKAGEETFDLKNGDKYRANGRVNGAALKKGDIVFAIHDQHNTGAELYQVIGFGEDDAVKYDSVKAAFAATGTKNLKDLEAHNGIDGNEDVRLIVRDLDTGDEGDYFYLFNGRWAYGSGAEPLTFIKVEKV